MGLAENSYSFVELGEKSTRFKSLYSEILVSYKKYELFTFGINALSIVTFTFHRNFATQSVFCASEKFNKYIFIDSLNI